MREYNSGKWGFHFILSHHGSVFPQALLMALPNAGAAYAISMIFEPQLEDDSQQDRAFKIWAGFTGVMTFLLFFRSNTAYNRWWEGGTLLQQVRGEWFNAYSSLIAFSTLDEKKAADVDEFQHLLARLMSLLFCCALKQVHPDSNKVFEIMQCNGLNESSLEFLQGSSDRVEVLLQWIQRSVVINMANGVLPIPPPVISRVFQELSRGIVNLQNARKIADFPFPFPYAQTSVVMLLIHWCLCPIFSSMLLEPATSACTCFAVVFFLWCINYIALQLEMPFGDDVNDLPMDQMQRDWNRSLSTLLARYAQRPPKFDFDEEEHHELLLSMSDGHDAEDPTRISHQVICAATGPSPDRPSGKESERESMASSIPPEVQAVAPPPAAALQPSGPAAGGPPAQEIPVSRLASMASNKSSISSRSTVKDSRATIAAPGAFGRQKSPPKTSVAGGDPSQPDQATARMTTSRMTSVGSAGNGPAVPRPKRGASFNVRSSSKDRSDSRDRADPNEKAAMGSARPPGRPSGIEEGQEARGGVGREGVEGSREGMRGTPRDLEAGEGNAGSASAVFLSAARAHTPGDQEDGEVLVRVDSGSQETTDRSVRQIVHI
eukprot:gnl/TRDRNA2_/TRDRNA2_130570_c0_seq3.p1 gnl/TRDRNA2_/TRDRNA2_130570_c0~~gnl/TRDRNA2_/TRDRNA2_130570_c0_seq3.p1  ORF type:complete len:604 (+),score=75.48 gnl/TRDRNA2_/TRDRNA2_130570_c0_seq3:70-1881(+)